MLRRPKPLPNLLRSQPLMVAGRIRILLVGQKLRKTRLQLRRARQHKRQLQRRPGCDRPSVIRAHCPPGNMARKSRRDTRIGRRDHTIGLHRRNSLCRCKGRGRNKAKKNKKTAQGRIHKRGTVWISEDESYQTLRHSGSNGQLKNQTLSTFDLRSPYSDLKTKKNLKKVAYF